MNRIHAAFAAFAVAFAVLLPVTPARAGVTVYTDPAAFLSALVGPYYTEGFNNLNGPNVDAITPPASLNFPGNPPTYATDPRSYYNSLPPATGPNGTGSNGFSYTVTENSGLYVNASGGHLGGQSLGSSNYGDSLLLHSFSSNVNGVGGWFASVNGSGIPVASTEVKLVFTTTTGSTTEILPESSASWVFYGFLSSNPLTSLTVQSWDPSGNHGNGGSSGTYYTAMDDITVGSAAPEPAFFQLGAMLALGGLGMLKIRRRQQPRILNQI